ncbi:hypothetical protein D3C72_418790 [compost metagenome]
MYNAVPLKSAVSYHEKIGLLTVVLLAVNVVVDPLHSSLIPVTDTSEAVAKRFTFTVNAFPSSERFKQTPSPTTAT